MRKWLAEVFGGSVEVLAPDASLSLSPICPYSGRAEDEHIFGRRQLCAEHKGKPSRDSRGWARRPQSRHSRLQALEGEWSWHNALRHRTRSHREVVEPSRRNSSLQAGPETMSH